MVRSGPLARGGVTRREALALALAVAATLLAGGSAFLQWTAGPGTQRVNILWSERVTVEDRVQAERTFGLARGERYDGRVWQYVVRTRTRANIERLLRDRRVEDAYHINHTTFEVELDRPDLTPSLRAVLQSDHLDEISLVFAIVAAVCAWRGRRAARRIGTVCRSAAAGVIGRVSGVQPGAGVTMAVALALGAATATIRFLAPDIMHVDDFEAMAGAQQMLLGDWPTRDFVDLGKPLMYIATAVAQLLVGRLLYAHVLLTSAAFGLAVAVTVVAGRALSGSLWVGVVAALIEFVSFPRGFSYPMMLLYAAAPIVIGWTIERPTRPRLLWLAVFVQVAFLFRHDHGLYIGAGAMAAVILSGPGRLRPLWHRARTFVVLGLLVALPYLAYLGYYGALVHHFRQGVGNLVVEESYLGHHLPSFGVDKDLAGNAEAFLYFLFYLIPLAAAVVLAARWSRLSAVTRGVIGAVIVIALGVDAGFLRDPLAQRLADAVVPAVLLCAWIVGLIAEVRSPVLKTLLVTTACLGLGATAGAMATVRETRGFIEDTRLAEGLGRLPANLAARRARLTERWNRRVMSEETADVLIPFFQYLDRCTTTAQRVLVPGFHPNVQVYTGRKSAGSRLNIIPIFPNTPDERGRILRAVQQQDVPFAIVSTRYKEMIWTAHPELAQYIDTQFRSLVTYPIYQTGLVDVRVNRSSTPHGVDPQTGWPCFRD